MRFGQVIFLAIMLSLGFAWLDSNVQWIHNLTPWGQREMAEREAKARERLAYCQNLEPTRRYHRVVERTELELDATDSDGDVVRMDVFRVSVTPLYQLRQDEWVSSFSIGDKNSTYQRSPIELFEIEEKSGPQAEDQKLLVRTACERMEIMIREFEGRQSLEEKDRRKLEALLDARSTPIMMPDSTRKGSGLPIYVTYFVPVQFPMLTPWELSTQKRKAQSRGLN